MNFIKFHVLLSATEIANLGKWLLGMASDFEPDPSGFGLNSFSDAADGTPPKDLLIVFTEKSQLVTGGERLTALSLVNFVVLRTQAGKGSLGWLLLWATCCPGELWWPVKHPNLLRIFPALISLLLYPFHSAFGSEVVRKIGAANGQPNVEQLGFSKSTFVSSSTLVDSRRSSS